MTNTTAYSPRTTEYNGVNGSVLQLNLAAPPAGNSSAFASVTLNFSFVASGTGEQTPGSRYKQALDL